MRPLRFNWKKIGHLKPWVAALIGVRLRGKSKELNSLESSVAVTCGGESAVRQESDRVLARFFSLCGVWCVHVCDICVCCMCMCVSPCEYGMEVCVYMCVDAPSCALMSCVVPQPSFFLEPGSLIAPEVPGWSGLTACEPQASSCLCLLSAGLSTR